MKGSWQRWTAAGLLVGGLLGAGGCVSREDIENTGGFQTPIQDKYQPPVAGAASDVGPGGSEREPQVREGLGVGLAESYDAPEPPGTPATGGAGRQGQRASDVPQGPGANQDTSGLRGGSGQPHTRTPGGD